MRDETLADVYASNVTGAQYDAEMKNLMSNKEVIVPLLQMAVPEFKDCSQEEIVRCLDISSITKDDFVSDIPDIKADAKISRDDSELSSLLEKLVRQIILNWKRVIPFGYVQKIFPRNCRIR